MSVQRMRTVKQHFKVCFGTIFIPDLTPVWLVNLAQIYNCAVNMTAVCVRQEFVAYGAANIGSALLSGHVSAAGLSRSLLQRAVGGATQATSLIACLVMALVIHLAGPFFQHMPLVTTINQSCHYLLESFIRRRV